MSLFAWLPVGTGQEARVNKAAPLRLRKGQVGSEIFGSQFRMGG